jgi:hypothetical protein
MNKIRRNDDMVFLLGFQIFSKDFWTSSKILSDVIILFLDIMAPSDNNNPTQRAGLAESPHSNTLTTLATETSSSQRSWARAITKKRSSSAFVQFSFNSKYRWSNIDRKGMPTVFKSSIWRLGHDPGRIFLDMTGRKETKIEFLNLTAKQYPSRVDVLTQQVGSFKFAEINFDSATSSCHI